MFTRIDGFDKVPAGTMTFDDQKIPFHTGDTVAAALLAAGIGSFRQHPIGGGERAPYCMMGACFECLLQINGRQNQQACLIAARPEMVLKRQMGARLLPSGSNE